MAAMKRACRAKSATCEAERSGGSARGSLQTGRAAWSAWLLLILVISVAVCCRGSERRPTFPALPSLLQSGLFAEPTEVFVRPAGRRRLQDLLPPILRVVLGLLAARGPATCWGAVGRGAARPAGRDAPGAGQVVAAAGIPAAPVPRVAARAPQWALRVGLQQG